MGYRSRRGTGGRSWRGHHSKEFFFWRSSNTSRTLPSVLARLAPLLSPGGRLVATTPHPIGRWPLEAGAALGLLSSHAHDEHERLLGKAGLDAAGRGAGLALVVYRRFLLGMNQLAVFSR